MVHGGGTHADRRGWGGLTTGSTPAAADVGSVRGDSATLDLVWGRVEHAFEPAAAAEVTNQLTALRSAAAAEDLGAASAAAAGLRASIGAAGWR